MVEPDEAEAERIAGRERLLGRADGGDPGGSAAQQRSRVAGGQSVLKILLRAQLRDAVSGELALQGAAKTLAIFEPRSTAIGIAIRRISQVEQGQSSGERAETLNFNLQPPAAFTTNTANPSHQISSVVPALDGHDTPAGCQGEIRRGYGERIVSRFEEHGLAAGLKEPLNRGVGGVGVGFGAGGVQYK
jgi:hypothetical protein